MSRYFDITTPEPELPLGAERSRVSTFTVSNATPSTIGGQAVIDPGPGAEPGWFTIDRPGRTFPPQHSESVAVTLAVPTTVAPGRYGFVLRVLLGGGVPEEDYDDSPLVTFVVPEVAPIPTTPPPVPPPPRKFPWWIVIVAAVIALILIVAIVGFIVTRPPAVPTPPPATPTPPPAGPDLTLRNLIGSAEEPIVSVEIANIGDQPAGQFNLAFTVTRIGAGLSPFVINVPIAGLGPDATVSRTFDSEVFGRPIQVLATVDTANTVAESNEANNTVQSQF